MQLLMKSPRPGQYVGHKVPLVGKLYDGYPEIILRVVLKPETVATYHPQTGQLHFDTKTGAITGLTFIGSSKPGAHTNERFCILVIHCTQKAELEIDSYLSRAGKEGWPGISELPEGTRVLVELSVIRNDHKAEIPDKDELENRPIDIVTVDNKKVFIIHGRNIAARTALEQFLYSIGLHPVDFDQLAANQGGAAFIGDIVRAGISCARGVIALFTPDEFSALHPTLRSEQDSSMDHFRRQARPNVIFEAGMAYGMVPQRTILVTIGSGVALFSDVNGVHVIRLNNDVQSRSLLRQKLLGVGCELDQRSDAWTDPSRSGDFESCIQHINQESSCDPFKVIRKK